VEEQFLNESLVVDFVLVHSVEKVEKCEDRESLSHLGDGLEGGHLVVSLQ